MPIPKKFFSAFATTDTTAAKQLAVLKTQQPGLKTLLSIGGWKTSTTNAGLLKKVVATAAARTAFVKSVVEVIQKNTFDGLDIDIDLATGISLPGCAALLVEMKTAFANVSVQQCVNKTNWLLTASAPVLVSSIDALKTAGLDASQLPLVFDMVNLKSYDFKNGTEKVTGFNSPLNDRGTEQASIAL